MRAESTKGKTKEEIITAMKESFSQIAPEINFSEIRLEKPLRDQVEIDSLDLYNIINLLQKKTNTHVSDTQLASLLTLNDLIKFLSEID